MHLNLFQNKETVFNHDLWFVLLNIPVRFKSDWFGKNCELSIVKTKRLVASKPTNHPPPSPKKGGGGGGGDKNGFIEEVTGTPQGRVQSQCSLASCSSLQWFGPAVGSCGRRN